MENQDKFKKWFYITLIFSFLVIGVSLFTVNKQKEIIGNTEYNNQVLADSIKLYKTKEGLNAGRIKVFESLEAKYFYNLSTKDTTILKLQKLVKQNEKYISQQGSISLIVTQAHAEIIVPTKIKNDPLIPEKDKYPIYESNFNLKGWIWGNSVATRDSTSYKLNYREELSLVIGREKTGFLGLGKGTPYADVTLYNPYSVVKDMRVYQTSLPKDKKFGIGPNASYGIGKEFKPELFIGIGVSYDLIQF